MASEVKFDLRFEISLHDYTGIHVDIVSNSRFGYLRDHGIRGTYLAHIIKLSKSITYLAVMGFLMDH